MLSLLLLATSVLGGVALALLDDEECPAHVLLARGAVLGLALLGLAGYPLASWLGMRPLAVALASLVALLPVALAPWARWRRLLPERPPLPAAASALAMAVLLLVVFDRAFYTTPDGIFTGIEHNLGDLPFHLGVVAGFTRGENFPPEHPELSGARLTYPFLADFGVAQLVAAGLALRPAVLLQNALLALALLALLHRLTLRMTGDPWAARLAPLLLFVNGGLGFVRLLEDARQRPLPELLLRLPQDYTITRDGELRFGNTLICLLGPQRALLLGAPLFVIALELLWRAVNEPAGSPRRTRLLLAAGLVAALLPLAHVHALLSLLAVAACLALLFPPRRQWLLFFGASGALALPQALWLAQGSSLQAGGFLAWQPGWDSGGKNPLAFWLMNTGAFLPLLAVSWLRTAPAPLARFQLPFFGLFLAPNLLRLSPWIWDNVKFLFFWLLAATPLVALLLARLLRRGGRARAAAAVLLVSLMLAGALDLWRVASRQIALRVFDAEALACAARLARATPPRALVLRAPSFDSPVLLAGRRSLLGYPGHIWSQGLDAGSREQDLARIYAGGWDAPELLARHRVDFILVGPQERARYRPDEAFLARFPLVLRSGAYDLRRVGPGP